MRVRHVSGENFRLKESATFVAISASTPKTSPKLLS